MRQQPAVLAENSERYFEELTEAISGYSPDLVVLVARGSSDHAALYARYLIEIHLGIPVTLAAPSVLTRYGTRLRYPKSLAVGISQSGAAPDVSEVLLDLRRQGHRTIAITNTAGSRITESADACIELDAGQEESIAATKTYTSSLLAVYQLARAMGAALPETNTALPEDAWLRQTQEAAEVSLGPIVRCNPIFCLARGYGFCTAQETALKLMECAMIPAKAYSIADFQHGPRALATHGTAAVVYGESVDNLDDTGTALVTAPSADAIAAPLKPIWEIFFGQWLALLSARARGLDPDRAQGLSKVTRTL